MKRITLPVKLLDGSSEEWSLEKILDNRHEVADLLLPRLDRVAIIRQLCVWLTSGGVPDIPATDYMQYQIEGKANCEVSGLSIIHASATTYAYSPNVGNPPITLSEAWRRMLVAQTITTYKNTPGAGARSSPLPTSYRIPVFFTLGDTVDALVSALNQEVPGEPSYLKKSYPDDPVNAVGWKSLFTIPVLIHQLRINEDGLVTHYSSQGSNTKAIIKETFTDKSGKLAIDKTTKEPLLRPVPAPDPMRSMNIMLDNYTGYDKSLSFVSLDTIFDAVHDDSPFTARLCEEEGFSGCEFAGTIPDSHGQPQGQYATSALFPSGVVGASSLADRYYSAKKMSQEVAKRATLLHHGDKGKEGKDPNFSRFKSDPRFHTSREVVRLFEEELRSDINIPRLVDNLKKVWEDVLNKAIITAPLNRGKVEYLEDVRKTLSKIRNFA